MNHFDIDADDRDRDVTFHHIYHDYPHLHEHDYWECFIVTSGSYHQQINGEMTTVNKNDGYLIRPSDCHELEDAEKPSSHLNILIKRSFMEEKCAELLPALLDLLLSSAPLSIMLSEGDLQRVFEYTGYLKHGSKTPERDLATNLLVFFLLEKVIKQNNILGVTKPKWLNDFLKVINSPSHMDYGVKELLPFTNYSHTQLARKFKEYMGVTLIDYLTTVRMGNAHDYLMHSELSILEISEALGYGSVSHFNHVFKAHFGVSPSSYRKQKPHATSGHVRLDKQAPLD